MQHVYVAKQPILNAKSDIIAYEILYHEQDNQEKQNNNRYQSAAVFSTILNIFGTKKLLAGKRAFVKVGEKFLLSDLIFSIPKEFFIFSLLSEVELTDRVVERLAILHKRGYLLALDDFYVEDDFLEEYEDVLTYFSYLRVYITNSLSLRDIIKKVQSLGVKVLGVAIEDEDDFLLAKEMGCDAFEGYFFAKPKILKNQKLNPTRQAVVRLYNVLMEDRNIDELADEFEKNPEITVKLLQFINSASFSFRQKISSIHHVIVLVGRVQLAKWLMLMIYSKSVASSFEASPLMLMVKNRTELMERIVKAVDPQAGSNMIGEAFMVGVLSLMDTVFSMPLEEILDNINVSDEVKAALLEDEGFFGDIYKVVRAMESMDMQEIHLFEMKYDLESNKIKDIIFDALEEVAKLENPAQIQ